MQITVTLNHTDAVAPEILAFLQSLTAGNTNVTNAAPLKVHIPKAETAKKEIVAKTVVVEKAEKTEETVKEIIMDAAVPETAKVSLEQVRAAVQAKAQADKRVEIKALLTTYEVENVTSLPKENYADFLTKINAL